MWLCDCNPGGLLVSSIGTGYVYNHALYSKPPLSVYHKSTSLVEPNKAEPNMSHQESSKAEEEEEVTVGGNLVAPQRPTHRSSRNWGRKSKLRRAPYQLRRVRSFRIFGPWTYVVLYLSSLDLDTHVEHSVLRNLRLAIK